jgi:hypothetical protein
VKRTLLGFLQRDLRHHRHPRHRHLEQHLCHLDFHLYLRMVVVVRREAVKTQSRVAWGIGEEEVMMLDVGREI